MQTFVEIVESRMVTPRTLSW